LKSPPFCATLIQRYEVEGAMRKVLLAIAIIAAIAGGASLVPGAPAYACNPSDSGNS
jgi:hypothetical protein